MSSAGLIRERRVGRARLVSADPSSRYARPLTELLALAFGPHLVIGEEFASPVIRQVRSAPLVWVSGSEPDEVND